MKQPWIHLLLQCFIVIISSNGDTVKNLTGIEGGSITFPQPVVVSGFLIYGGKVIASVTGGETTILEDSWKGKVHWNNTTGFFTITGLQTNDSGRYTVSVPNGATAVYELTVFESVWIRPVVRVNETSESCTLVCAVEKPAGTTLCWYRDGDRVKQSSSSLSLPLTITWQELSSSYRCEANTSAEVKHLEVNATALCSGDSAGENRSNQGNSGIIVIIVVVVIILLIAIVTGYFVIKWWICKRSQSTEDTQSKEPEVLYSDINIVKSQERPSPRPTRPVDQSDLTTIYSKLEVHNQRCEVPC